MGSLSQRLHLGVQQKQILTPGLVQMVTVLQLNRLELKDMIMNEIAENPVLEEATDAGEELTPDELQPLLEREAWTGPGRRSDPGEYGAARTGRRERAHSGGGSPESGPDGVADGAITAPDQPKTETDPFDEIDFGSFFDDYLDPGYKSPASELVEKPSFETFLSSPVTLCRSSAFAVECRRAAGRRARRRRGHHRQPG